MALKEQLSRSNLGSVSFNSGDHSSGACNLFGEMPESEWRSPSRVLEVTIHRAYYPITEKVLHLVFDPFGEVEHVHMLGRLDHVLAQVVFKTKHAAAEAFGELHGRNIYDGCCQMEIKWGHHSTTEMPDKAAPNMSPLAAQAPTASATSTTTTLTTSYATSTSTTFSDITVDDPASKHDTEQLIITEDDITNDKLASDTVELVVSMPTAAPATPSMTTVASLMPTVIEFQDIPKHVKHLSNSMESRLSNARTAIISLQNTDCSMEVQRYINSTPAYSIGEVLACPAAKVYDACKVFGRGASHESVLLWPMFGSIVHKGPWPHAVQFGSQVDSVQLRPIPWPSFYIHAAGVNLKKSGSLLNITVFPQESSLGVEPHITIFSIGRESAIALWPPLVKKVGQQPWPTMRLEVVRVSSDLRPMSWPSFTTSHDLTVGRCYSSLRKPQWPLPVHMNSRFLPAGMLQSLECMRLTSLRLVELEPWPPLHKFTTNEVTLYTQLQACFLILPQVTRQWKGSGVYEIMELTLIEATGTNCSYHFLCLYNYLSSIFDIGSLTGLMCHKIYTMQMTKMLTCTIYRASTIMEANGKITNAVFRAPLKKNNLTLMRFFKMLPEQNFERKAQKEQFSWDPGGTKISTERQRTDDMLCICVCFLGACICVTRIMWIVSSKLMKDHSKDSVVTYILQLSVDDSVVTYILQLSVDQVRGGRNMLYNTELQSFSSNHKNFSR